MARALAKGGNHVSDINQIYEQKNERLPSSMRRPRDEEPPGPVVCEKEVRYNGTKFFISYRPPFIHIITSSIDILVTPLSVMRHAK